MGKTRRGRLAARGRTVAALALAVALVGASPAEVARAAALQLADGSYEVPVTLSGGSGRAFISSPVKVVVNAGQAVATIVWSSSSYDKMTVAGTDYVPVTTEGGSTFEIPVSDDAVEVQAETTAMGTPHTIAYAISLDTAAAEPVPEGAMPALVAGVLAALLVLGIVLGVVASRRKAGR